MDLPAYMVGGGTLLAGLAAALALILRRGEPNDAEAAYWKRRAVLWQKRALECEKDQPARPRRRLRKKRTP